MDFDKRLREIIEDYEETKKMFNITEVDYQTNSCADLDEFIEESLRNGDEITIKKFIDNLGLVLKYTSYYSKWMNYKDIYNYPSFYVSLKKNIKYYPFDNKTILFEKMMTDREIAHKFCDYHMLDVLLDGDCDSPGLCNIFNLLPSGDKILFLKTVLNKKVHLSFKRYYFSNKEYVFVLENYLEFLKLTGDLFDFSKKFDEDLLVTEKIDNYVSKHPEMIDDAILNEPYVKRFGSYLAEIILLVVKDVIKNENALLSDIEWLSGGGFSEVLRVKDKVIKIGKDRETESFPNNPYIVKPLLRKVITHENNRLFIEVTEMVDAKDEIDKEEMYELYVKLRKIGLICSDFHEKNVGILRKDNVIYWNRELSPSDEVLGLEPYIGDDELKAGDLVLHDADNIYHEGDPDALLCTCDLSLEFEEKYQKEKKLLLK